MTTRFDDKRVWLGGGAALAVLILVIGWFMVISPKLSSAADLRTQTQSVEQQNRALAAKVVKLKQENTKVPQLTASLRAALTALPFDSGLPDFTRQVAAQASANKVTLSSVSVGSATAVVASAVPVTPTATSTTATTATPSATAAPTAAASSGLLSISITLSSTGSAKNQLAFLKAIQVTGPRRALVLSTQLAPAGSTSIDVYSSMTTQLNIFTAPLTAAAQAQLQKLLRGDVSN